MSESKLLSVSETAQVLHTSTPTLRRWTKAGYIKAAIHPINHRRQYRLEDVAALKAKFVAAVEKLEAPNA